MRSSKNARPTSTNSPNSPADMIASYCRYRLYFKTRALTSRSSMTWKDTWLIRLHDPSTGRTGIGEAGMFAGLSCDDRPDFATVLESACRDISGGAEPCLDGFPSIRTGLETARASVSHDNPWHVYDSAFTAGSKSIATNGLVWMGPVESMERQIERKVDLGFTTIKIKVGALDFDSELALLASLRRRWSDDVIELRLDANGGFTAANVMQRLDALARFGVHSIEQPVKAGNYELMRSVAAESPIPVALDEELIGVEDDAARRELLSYIAPAYIILKPTLHGGFSGADRWIEIADALGIGYWATSALESTVGLNAIAQWAATKNIDIPQGLGTGALYINNFPSPVSLTGQWLSFDPLFNDPPLVNLPWITP